MFQIKHSNRREEMEGARRGRPKGQAMVEFALILGVLLLFIFVVIDGSRILWANLTVQNAARSGGRYAITGQFDPDCLDDPDPCDDPRVASIKATALEAMSGLNLDPDAGYSEPSFYAIEVFGTDESGSLIRDFAGIPGGTVIVRVLYRQETITPLLRPIAETVRVFGQVTFTNERFSQVETAGSGEVPPAPPLPTPGPTPTPRPPDVTVSKSDSIDPVIDGQDFSYTIEVSNIGESTATGVEVTDNFPTDDLILVLGSLPDDCSGTGPVVCTLPDIGPGGSASVTLEFTADTGETKDDVENQVSVKVDTESDTSNNDVSEFTDIVYNPTTADLELQKTAFPQEVVIGNTVAFNLIVTNHGLLQATNVIVTDTLPAGGTFTDFSSDDGCSRDGAEVTCSLGDIPRDETRVASFSIRANSAGDFTNIAVVGSDVPEPAGGGLSNDAQADFSIVDDADVGVTKAGPKSAGVTVPFTYTLDVHNNGPNDAQAVTASDELPGGLTFEAVSTTRGSCGESGGTITCDIGDLVAGNHAFISIRVRADTVGTYENTAVASSTTDDEYLQNNEDTETTPVEPRVDMSIAKSVNANNVTVGDQVIFDLEVTNAGPEAAHDVVVTDVLSDSLNFVSATPERGACDFAGGTVTCRVQTMEAGDSVSIAVEVVPFVADVQFENVATVEAEEIDLNLDDNEDSASLSVKKAPTPEVITLTPACGSAGDAFDVNGYFWPENKAYDVEITWDDGNGAPTLLSSFTITQSTWTEPVAVPNLDPNSSGPYTVAATGVPSSGGGPSITVQAQFVVPCTGAELSVSPIDIGYEGDELETGQPLTVTASVSNLGAEDAVDPFYVSLYFIPEGDTIGSNTHIDGTYRQASLAFDGLVQGASRAVTFSVSSGFAITGTHQIYVVADSDPGPEGIVAESNEENNLAGEMQTVVAGDDEPPEPTPTPEPGTTGTWSAHTHYLATGKPLGLVRLRFFDGGTLVAESYSDHEGFFSVELPAAEIAVDACIDVYDGDGNLVTYAANTTETITAGETQTVNVYLEESVSGSCSP